MRNTLDLSPKQKVKVIREVVMQPRVLRTELIKVMLVVLAVSALTWTFSKANDYIAEGSVVIENYSVIGTISEIDDENITIVNADSSDGKTGKEYTIYIGGADTVEDSEYTPVDYSDLLVGYRVIFQGSKTGRNIDVRRVISLGPVEGFVVEDSTATTTDEMATSTATTTDETATTTEETSTTTDETATTTEEESSNGGGSSSVPEEEASTTTEEVATSTEETSTTTEEVATTTEETTTSEVEEEATTTEEVIEEPVVEESTTTEEVVEEPAPEEVPVEEPQPEPAPEEPAEEVPAEDPEPEPAPEPTPDPVVTE